MVSLSDGHAPPPWGVHASVAALPAVGLQAAPVLHGLLDGTAHLSVVCVCDLAARSCIVVAWYICTHGACTHTYTPCLPVAIPPSTPACISLSLPLSSSLSLACTCACRAHEHQPARTWACMQVAAARPSLACCSSSCRGHFCLRAVRAGGCHLPPSWPGPAVAAAARAAASRGCSGTRAPGGVDARVRARTGARVYVPRAVCTCVGCFLYALAGCGVVVQVTAYRHAGKKKSPTLQSWIASLSLLTVLHFLKVVFYV